MGPEKGMVPHLPVEIGGIEVGEWKNRNFSVADGEPPQIAPFAVRNRTIAKGERERAGGQATITAGGLWLLFSGTGAVW